MRRKTAVIIGAGPAGLTAAYELLRKTDIKPIIYESSDDIGGISKTVNYKGNRIDIGGHRFFSKSDRVMNWWRDILPIQNYCERINDSQQAAIANKNTGYWEFDEKGPLPDKVDNVMLIRSRKSRILYLGKLFDYPISLSLNTICNLGLWRTTKIAASYLFSRIAPIRSENTLEEFFINRFGKELYATFFRDYTEKVWGTPCDQIKPEWGVQRIKGLSIGKAIFHALRKTIPFQSLIGNGEIETTLIEHFWYPKYGPGQLWEAVAKIIVDMGGEIHLNHRVSGIQSDNHNIQEVEIQDLATSYKFMFTGDYYFSTMPVKELIEGFKPLAPGEVRAAADGLVYRDFITVGLLLKKLNIAQDMQQSTSNNIIPDNWIYVQEPDLKVGRLQIFNNWSPYMVGDPNSVWVGLEYFCSERDDLWNKPDREIISLAISEMGKISATNIQDVMDSTIIRVPKAYPAYFGSYDQFPVIRKFVDRFQNLFLIGRNGMHRYNNQDHSMLAAMTAVDNIMAREGEKKNLWTINTEQEYHESRPIFEEHNSPSFRSAGSLE
jgi:protoporphyrinogen oxidase